MRRQARKERARRLHVRRGPGLFIAVSLALVLLLSLVASVWAWQSRPVTRPAAASAATLEPSAVSDSASASLDASSGAGLVEVPDVVGDEMTHAQFVLSTAGFRVVLEYEGSSATEIKVISQTPVHGTVVARGASVTLKVPAAAPQPKSMAPAGFVVCIDPGHQSRSDSRPEPVGPGSRETKPRVTGGATGKVTSIPECEIALQISMNLKRRLEAAGVRVVMTRTTNDISLSNAERAAIANKAKADLFIRIHGDGNPDDSVSGISTLYPAPNAWTTRTAAPSKAAAEVIQRSIVQATGAVDRGVVARGDIAGFNWATVPSLLVECGFLSNPVEDRLLASPHYQDKLASGIAIGVLSYLEQHK